MKNIGESSEVFEAYARIDFCYYGIAQIEKEVAKPESPINMMIDAVCGYDRVGQSKKAAIELTKEIIRSKKIIGADYSRDEEFLNGLKKMLKP